MRRFLSIFLCSLAFAQQQEVRRPTTDIDPGGIAIGCTGVSTPSGAMKNSYDSAGLTTSSSLVADGTDTQAKRTSRSFLTWQSTGNVYSALTLNINAKFAPQAPASGCIKYSADGGISYTTIKCDGGVFVGQTTYTIALSTIQDLAKLRVSACAVGQRGNAHAELDPGTEVITIYDIWTSGTNPIPATGDGSGSGQPHRGVVVSN